LRDFVGVLRLGLLRQENSRVLRLTEQLNRSHEVRLGRVELAVEMEHHAQQEMGIGIEIGGLQT
jgi:hypothetical protein